MCVKRQLMSACLGMAVLICSPLLSHIINRDCGTLYFGSHTVWSTYFHILPPPKKNPGLFRGWTTEGYTYTHSHMCAYVQKKTANISTNKLHTYEHLHVQQRASACTHTSSRSKSCSRCPGLCDSWSAVSSLAEHLDCGIICAAFLFTAQLVRGGGGER